MIAWCDSTPYQTALIISYRGRIESAACHLWFDWLNYIRTAHSAELDWLNYIRTAVGAELFLALYLSTAFCARITEALMLRAQDFDWDREQVHFGAFKYGKSTDKPMVPSVKKQLLGVKRNGIVCPSKWVNCGARGWQLQDRTYRFPSSGFLFPSRNGAKVPPPQEGLGHPRDLRPSRCVHREV